MSLKSYAKFLIVTVSVPFSVAFIFYGVTVALVDPNPAIVIADTYVALFRLIFRTTSFVPVGIDFPVVHFMDVADTR